MTASTVFFVLLVLACPLMMVWMMRGGHGHGGHGHNSHAHDDDAHAPPMRERSAEGLRALRAEIDQMIEDRKQAEHEQSQFEPTVGSRR